MKWPKWMNQSGRYWSPILVILFIIRMLECYLSFMKLRTRGRGEWAAQRALSCVWSVLKYFIIKTTTLFEFEGYALAVFPSTVQCSSECKVYGGAGWYLKPKYWKQSSTAVESDVLSMSWNQALSTRGQPDVNLTAPARTYLFDFHPSKLKSDRHLQPPFLT